MNNFSGVCSPYNIEPVWRICPNSNPGGEVKETSLNSIITQVILDLSVVVIDN